MIVTRFAPSPTWRLHVGSVRTALYSYLLANQQKDGIYILRIEDTDVARSTKLFEKNMIDMFRRLWLDRHKGVEKNDDGGPYHQMARLEIYNQYLQKLLDAWQAYYARESTEELDAMRAEAEARKQPFRYRQKEYTPEQLAAFKEEGRKPVVRFKVQTDRKVSFTDLVKGETTFDMREFDDFVIVKSDGIPTYHFAVVVDDITMNITHVIRAEEHFTNTPKHILLFETFGAQHPQFGHLPLLLNPQGKKMSKRDDPALVGMTLVDDYQAGWFLPEAILNFVSLLWRNPWTEQEIFTLDELVKTFSMERVHKANAVYDFKRALWFNGEWIKKLSDEEFIQRTKDYLYLYGDEERKEIVENTEPAYRNKLAPYIKVRIQTLGQFRDYCKYFFIRLDAKDEVVLSEKMWVTKELLSAIMPEVIELLERLSDEQWTEETIKEELISYIAAKSLKNGQLLRPLRAILTWVEASPGAFEMLYVLGKEESLVRLKEYK